MFYKLHRLVKWFFVALMAAGCYWLYLQREALEPVWVWYDVYENGGLEKTAPLPILQGEGIAIVDGHTFQMKGQGRIYSVRLTGFNQPEPPLSNQELSREKARRAKLRDFVVGKNVNVEVTYSNLNSVLGIVHAGPTNINTYFVANDLSEFNREYVKSVPRDQQYRFFAAARTLEKKRTLALRSE